MLLFSFSINTINGQVKKDALLGKWIGVSEEIYEMKEESFTMDGKPIKVDIVIDFRSISALDVIENGIEYKRLNYKILKSDDDLTYLFFGNREYLISSISEESLILIKANTTLPMKIIFKKGD